jgi:predicted alpha/beta hydrolase
VEITLTAADGYRLAATLYGEPSEKAVLVLPATGVPQGYYAKFAAWLAQRGFQALTFDYRGIGKSLHGDVRAVRARMRDWALLDAAAAMALLLRGNSRIEVVGHSFGGQALGLLPSRERISSALIVGSQSGYWRHWPPLGQAWMWPVTHLALPGLAHLRGYFPGSRLGFGEDLPKGVAIEWARWCRHPTYLVGSLGVESDYAHFTAPIRAYAFTDDPFAPLRAVHALMKLYPRAPSEVRSMAPRDLGVQRVGHFGFFRESFKDTLWLEAAEWLGRNR